MMLVDIAGLEFSNKYSGFCLIQHISTYWVGYDSPGNDLSRGARGIYGVFLCLWRKSKKKKLSNC